MFDELVDVAACEPGHDIDAFVQMLRVEATGAEVARPPGAAPFLSHCDLGAGRAVLQVGEQSVTLDVGDVPRPARFRTLAVAVIETLRNWPIDAEYANDAEPAPPVATDTGKSVKPVPARVAPAAASSSPTVPSSSPAWALSLALEGQVLGPALSASWGGALGLRRAWPNAWAIVAVSGYQTAVDDSALGSARAHLIPLGAFIERRWGSSAELRVGLGGLWTYVIVDADSRWGLDEPRRRTYWGGLGLQTTLAVPAEQGWAVLVGTDLLWAARGANLTAGAEPGFTYYGLGAGLRVGVEVD